MENPPFDLIIKNADLVLSNPAAPLDFKMEALDVGIRNGKIEAVGTMTNHKSQSVWDAKGLTILPGLIDTQVHFREPGLEHKETLATGSKSAVAGGITGFFEMPNTNPATLTVQDVRRKVQLAKDSSFCDFAFYAGAADSNISILCDLEKEEGCCGIKVFMGSSTGKLLVDTDEVLDKVLQNTSKRIAVHCEDEPRLIERRKIAEDANGDVSKHAEWRDAEVAFKATRRLLALAKKHNHPVHVLHISTKDEMEWLEQNKGTLATVETTPQHLTLTAPECYQRLGSLAQMNPPVRTEDHKLGIWQGIKNQTVDIIGSDHAPHTLEEKEKAYPNSPSGMPGVQTSLPVLIHHMNQGRIHLYDIVRLMAVNPTNIFGIKGRGYIEVGRDASFTVLDLKKEKTIETNWIESKCGWTPFDGLKVRGWPVATMIRGQFVMRDEEISRIAAKPFQFEA